MAKPCNKFRVRKWVKALESGEYQQCTGTLHNYENGFCCLGVATDLYMKSSIGKKRKTKWTGGSFSSTLVPVFRNDLPPEVMEYYGIDENNPKLGDKYAACLNDNCGATFKDIAVKVKETYGV